jgi:hypothetical protein
VLLVGLSPQSVRAQTDDFNDGNDNGWSRIDLAVLGSPATFSFPSDGAGGKAYKIFAPKPAISGFGPARAYGYRPEIYSRFVIGVDLLDWDTSVDQQIGLLVRAKEIFLGGTDGYVMNYSVASSTIQITPVQNETPPPDAIAEVDVVLSPVQGPYRWVLTTDGGEILLGQIFSVKDLKNPLVSAVARDTRYASGQAGVFIFDYNDEAYWTNATATFDNYSAVNPPAGSLRPAITELAPKPLSQLTSTRPAVKVGILDLDSFVQLNSIRLWMDNVEVPSANFNLVPEYVAPDNPLSFSGATLTYQVASPLAAGVLHTNRVVFQDDKANSITNDWTYWGIPVLRATNALPVGAGKDRGLTMRLVQTVGAENLIDNLIRAEAQLAVPSPYRIDIDTNITANTINFTQKELPSSPQDGYFPDEYTFPGIDTPFGDTDDFAEDMRFYLELTKGSYLFGVTSDDGFRLTSGSSLTNQTILIAESDASTFNGTFELSVEADGVYPFRMVHYERGGSANVELFTVNSTNANDRTLVNDPVKPGAIKAYRTVTLPQITLYSSPTLVPSAFALDGTGVIDTTARTVTVPKSGATRYYRLNAGTALRITEIRSSGNNILMTYQ